MRSRKVCFVVCFLLTVGSVACGAAEGAEPRTPRTPDLPERSLSLLKRTTPRTPAPRAVTKAPEPESERIRQPEPTPAPTVSPSSTVLSPRERVLAAWPGDVRWAARVTDCESIDYTDFYNESSGAEGPWQFIPSTWARVLGQTGSPMDYSFEYQTEQAWRLLHIQGRHAWDCH